MKLRILAGVIPLVILVSCGTVTVNTTDDHKIYKTDGIVIIAPNDPTGAGGELEFLLIERGFRVISANVGSVTTRTESTQEIGEKGASATTREISETAREVNARYLAELSYRYYYDVLYWAFTNFYLKVTDLDSGEIILTASFSGDRSVRAVLQRVADQLLSASQ